MATNATNTHQRSDEALCSMANTLADRIGRSFTIGTDADGNTHHYYRAADTVVVFDGRELEHREHLDGRTVGAWASYVDDTRGWRDMGQFAAVGIRVDRERKR